MMRSKRLHTVLLAAVFAAGLAITGCSGNKTDAASDGAAKSSGVIINLGTEPPQMNTLLAADDMSHNVQRHVFEGLTRLGKDGKPIPGIAEKWTTSPDGLTWTFTLRDSKWSDGSAVTAKDFEFAFKEALKKETAAEYAYLFYMFKNGEAYNKGIAKAEDVGVTAKDDKTLVLTLEAPAPFILNLLALGNFSPVKKNFYEKQAGKYGSDADRMIYNGPWTIKEWQHESSMILVKNPNYWNAKEIKLDKITMLMINDANASLNSFLGNEADMVGLTGDQIEKAKAEGYEAIGYPDGATFYFEFNVKDSVMQNKNIRKAMTLAIDRQAFVKGVLKNKSLPATSFTNPVIFGKKESFSKEIGVLVNDNNADEAKKLFAKGLEELNLKAAPRISIICDDASVAKRDAQVYQEMWKKNLNINVQIDSMPFKAILERMKNKDFQIIVAGWGADYNDPISFLEIFETGNGNNHSQYAVKEYDELLGRIRKEADAGKRMDMLKQLEKKLMDDMPIGPIYFRYREYIVKPYLKGIVRQWGQDIDLYWAYVDAGAKK